MGNETWATRERRRPLAVNKTRSSHGLRAAVATCLPASRKANCGAMLTTHLAILAQAEPLSMREPIKKSTWVAPKPITEWLWK